MIDLTFIERIEGLQKEDATKLKDKMEFIKKGLIDEFHEIEVETITPLITGGALGKQDSIIRASEIKAILRWFIRYILYASSLDKEKSKKYLVDIFGGIYEGSLNEREATHKEKKGRDSVCSSFFDVIVEGKLEADKLRSLDSEELKRRDIRKEDFGHRLKGITRDRGIEADRIIFPGYRFKIIFVKKRDLEILIGKEKELFELFELILQVFGFGRLYRRGFGKILILNKSYNSMENILKEIRKKVKSIFNIDLRIGYLEGERFNLDNIVDIEGRGKINLENEKDCHILVHKLYICKDWMDAIAEIAKAVRKKSGDFSKDEKGSIIAIFMGLPRSDKIKSIKLNNGKIIEINKNIKIPSSVIYTVLQDKNQYVVYSILLLKSKKWFMLRNIRDIRDIIRPAIDNYRYIF